MKNIVLGILALSLLIGVIGCMKQPTNNDKKEKEVAMLKYLQESYERDFTIIDYIPAERGFNDDFNENILVAESEGGILVNVKEKLRNPGEFYDDFVNSYVTKSLEGIIDYSTVKNIHHAKTYATLKFEHDNIDYLKKNDLKIEKQDLFKVYSIISIESESNEEILEQLYRIYEQLQELGNENNSFIVAFAGDQSKAENYVNNFFLHGIQEWKKYDNSIKEILKIAQNGLSFEQFKEELVLVGG